MLMVESKLLVSNRLKQRRVSYLSTFVLYIKHNLAIILFSQNCRLSLQKLSIYLYVSISLCLDKQDTVEVLTASIIDCSFGYPVVSGTMGISFVF